MGKRRRSGVDEMKKFDEKSQRLLKLPKEVLVMLLRRHVWQLSEREILSAYWDYLSAEAQQKMEEACAIKIAGGKPDTFKKHMNLWDEAERLHAEADKVWADFMGRHDKGNKR